MTEHSIKIVYFCLENYQPLYESLGLTKFDFNRYDSPNKIVLILGGNGTGKSFIINELTPIPLEHVAFRTTSRIIPGKDGKKKIEFLVDDMFIYTCEIFYPSDKKTQCFFRKKDIATGVEVELNPNGNVNSYLELLEQEFGLVKNYTNIGYFSSAVKSIVEMTPAERNNLISTWLPNVTEPLTAFKIAQKKYNAIKRDVDALTEDINKISIDEYTHELERSTYSLKDREEKLNYVRGKLSEGRLLYNTVKDISQDSLKESIKLFKTETNLLYTEGDSLSNIISDLNEYSGKDGKAKLKLVLDKEKEKHARIKSRIESINESLSQIKTSIDTITPQINISNTEYSLPDIITSISTLDKEVNEFTKTKASIESESDEFYYEFDNESNSKYQLLFSILYDIYHITGKIKMLLGSYTLQELLQDTTHIIDMIGKKELFEKNKLSSIRENISQIEKRIHLLSNAGIDESILREAPKTCSAKTCPVLKELYTYTAPDAEIAKLTSELSIHNANYNSISQNIEDNIQREKNNITLVMSCIDDINNMIFRNKDTIAQFPKPVIEKINVDTASLINDIEFIIEYIKRWDEYISLCEKLRETKESIETLNNVKRLLIVKNDKEKELEIYSNRYRDYSNERENLINELSTIENNITLYVSLDEKQDIVQDRILKYEKESSILINKKNQLSIYNKKLYYKKHLEKLLRQFSEEEINASNDITNLKYTISDISNKIISRKALEERRDKFIKQLEKYEILMNVWNPRTGYPSFIIQGFLDTVKDVTNRDLLNVWGGILAIKEFIINNNEFSISVQKGNTPINDVSECSGAERATLSLALSIAIIEVNSQNMLYNIIRIDESDGAFDERRRQAFLDIITSRLDIMNCQNSYIISHNKSFSDIVTDVILLPGHGLSTEDLANKNILFVA